MKKNILMLFAFITLLGTYSCSSDADNQTDSATNSIQTRALPSTADSEEEAMASLSAKISQKWGFGEEYIDLNDEGTFDAMFDGKHITGRWGLVNGTEDKQTLKLFGKDADSESNENTFNRTYELINVSYNRLVAIDSEGKEINFFPETKK